MLIEVKICSTWKEIHDFPWTQKWYLLNTTSGRSGVETERVAAVLVHDILGHGYCPAWYGFGIYNNRKRYNKSPTKTW